MAESTQYNLRPRTDEAALVHTEDEMSLDDPLNRTSELLVDQLPFAAFEIPTPMQTPKEASGSETNLETDKSRIEQLHMVMNGEI